MDFKTSEDKIVCTGDDGKVLGELDITAGDDGVLEITRTFVDPAARGMGLAGQLMEHAAASLRKDGKTARPVCSYAEHWFEKHPEEADLIAK